MQWRWGSQSVKCLLNRFLIRIPNRKIHHKGFVSSKLDEVIWFYDDLIMIIDIPKEINDLEWTTIGELHLKIIDGIFFHVFWVALWIATGSMQIPLSSGHLSLPFREQQSDEIDMNATIWGPYIEIACVSSQRAIGRRNWWTCLN